MDRNEIVFGDFVKEKIEKAGGSVQVKYLCQLLPSQSYDIRNSVASNQVELMKFLYKYSHLFKVDANGNVRLQTAPSSTFPKEEFRNTTDQSDKPSPDLPDKLTNAEGVVIKIHPTFGFISAKNPFKTTVYFTPNCFGDKTKPFFTDFEDLSIGKRICFNAIKGKDGQSTKYRVTRAWFPRREDDEEEYKKSNNIQNNPRKTRDTGLYDALFYEGEGSILKLFPTYGFIVIDNDPNNTVFFNKSQVCNYENITDLTKALKIGNLVEFKAVRPSKQNIKARWAATQVLIKKSDKVKTSSKKSTVEPDQTEERQYIKGKSGKIFPHSKGTVIKFGPNYSQLADADSGLFYMLGTKVLDVSWEFADGDNVRFDAVEIKSHPGWKATLIWTGDRPNIVLPPDLGDFSEYIDEVESVPDSASCISKSSDNSLISEHSNKNSKDKSYSYSSKTSQKNINRSTKSSNFQNFNNKKPFKNNIEFSDRGSYRSKSPIISTSEAGNRYSRRSKNRGNFKNNKFPEKSSRSLSTEKFVGPERKYYQSNREYVNSSKKNLSNDDDNLSTGSDFKEKLAFLSSLSQDDNKVYKNWGDSPFPGEEHETHSEDKNSLKEDLHSERGFSPESSKNYITDCDAEIYSSEDEFSDTVKYLNESEINMTHNEQVLKNSDLTIDMENEQPQKKASITRFHDIEGSVTKVYCKYADIESPKLLKPASFFWSDLYQNGAPVSEGAIDDLREVIKEGDVLKFNCMQIISDDGCCFIKITMLWRGKKPNIVELTPEQFISQTQLSVTLNGDNIYDYSETEPPVPPSEGNDGHEETAAELLLPIGKFLTSINDSDEDSVEDDPISIPASKGGAFNIPDDSKSTIVNQSEENFVAIDEKEQLVSGISRIISSNGLAHKHQIDLDIVSSQILDFVMKSFDVKKYPSPVKGLSEPSQSEVNHNDSSTESTHASTDSDHESIKAGVQFTNSEAQTIFTGNVSGQNIYTQC